jgi:hypothetical protein
MFCKGLRDKAEALFFSLFLVFPRFFNRVHYKRGESQYHIDENLLMRKELFLDGVVLRQDKNRVQSQTIPLFFSSKRKNPVNKKRRKTGLLLIQIGVAVFLSCLFVSLYMNILLPDIAKQFFLCSSIAGLLIVVIGMILDHLFN